MARLPLEGLNVVALAGGVGGAKLVDGLAQLIPSKKLTVIVNTGDDFEHLGLKICPDLDTVCYTLAHKANPATGWGREGETWSALETLGELGGPTWFRIGDRDLGLHLERSRRLNSGQPLSQVTAYFCKMWNITARVLPVTDDTVPTWVISDEGELPFQEYFVHRQCRPVVSGFRFDGASQAQPARGVLEAIQAADLIIFCPSNPWVSIDPILAIAGVRDAIRARREAGFPVLAVSPIIGGETVKGPAAKMFVELGILPSALSVAKHFMDDISGFVFDQVDGHQVQAIHSLKILPLVTDTLMKTPDDRRRLAKETLEFGIASMPD